MSRFRKIFSHFALNAIVLMYLILSLLFGCEKFEPKRIVKLATVTTTSISNITENSTKSGGNVTNDGGASVTARGVCWSTSQNPTTANSKTTDGTGTGSFTSNLTGLSCEIIYYVRAYATNSAGTAYGPQVSFTTSQCPALSVATWSIYSITENSAQSGGTLYGGGGAAIIAKGVCWSTSQNPTISDNHTTDVTGGGADPGLNLWYQSSITGLSPGTKYYVRAYATTSVGTVYGDEYNFTTTGQAIVSPTVTTAAATDIAETSATVGGNVTDDGGATVTERGVYYSTSASPETTGTKLQIGSGTGTFSTSLTGLSDGITYYIKAYATNSAGTAYGNQEIFTTYFASISDIDGNIYNVVRIGTQVWLDENLRVKRYSNGESIGTTTPAVVDISAETSPKYQWSYKEALIELCNDLQPLIDGGAGGLTFAQVEGLGIISALQRTSLETWATKLSISNSNTKTINTIYDQCTNISTTISQSYGLQYTWYVIIDSRNICPTGWHVPSDAEWTTLTDYLGGESIAGGKLKETGTTHWNSPNTGATNESGFTALPGGNRGYDGAFDGIGLSGDWWSSTEGSSTDAWSRYVDYDGSNVDRDSSGKAYGFSVRCVRD